MKNNPSKQEVNAHLDVLKQNAIDYYVSRYNEAQTTDEQYNIIAEVQRKLGVDLKNYI